MPEDAVWLALDQLKDEQLIENYKGSSGYFQGLTRREIIRRVGLTSMVALPFVTSIVAPKAVNAQSIDKCALESPGDFSDGCPCQNNPDCVSGCCSPAIICIGNNCAPDPNHRVCSPIIACR